MEPYEYSINKTRFKRKTTLTPERFALALIVERVLVALIVGLVVY